ncbi:MAG: ATP-binding protein [Pseudomonadota bacterium]
MKTKFEIFSDRIEITSTGGLSVIKNVEDFFSGYSNPTSRELMRIYKDLELVEHLGSGLNRILEIYDKDSFVIKQNYMKNIFYKNENPLNEGVNEGVKSLYELIKNNPNNRSTYFAKELHTSVKNVERWLKQLKDEDKIAFNGSPKTGGYVLK